MDFQGTAKDIFMTEIMPLMTEGMMSGFNCKWVEHVIDFGQKHLAELLAKFGLDWAASAVMMVAEKVLAMLGLNKCDQDSTAVADNLENALF